MSARHVRFAPGLRSFTRRIATGVMLCLTLLLAVPAPAAFHLWNIREVYTDASGTNQFIELFCDFGGQTILNGRQINVTAGGTTHTFTLTANVNDSASKALLFGTASIQARGAPAPDYIIPNNFLFATGATISFFGANSGAYTALPTDGVNSRTWGDGNAVNTPQNLAGQVGTISFANSPPLVSITSPLDNAVVAKPGPVPVAVSASDSDGSVANVQLLINGVPAATNAVAPFGFTLNNLSPGFYSLRARAVDNQAAVATSAPVTIRAAAQPVLSFAKGTNGPIQIQFNSATGITYVVDRALPLTNFSAVATNPGSGGVLQFSETNSSANQGTYRVRLQ